jgi:hypothetical protein
MAAPAALAAADADGHGRPTPHPAAKPAGRRRAAPAPPSSAAAPARPIAKPAAPPPAPAGASTTPTPGQPLFSKIRPALGCAHPDEYGLSAQERARCEELFSDLARAAPSFGSDVPPGKASAYARSLHCRRMSEAQGPPMEGVIEGPSLRQCPPGEH